MYFVTNCGLNLLFNFIFELIIFNLDVYCSGLWL